MATVLVGDIYVKGRSSTKVQISSSTGRSYTDGYQANAGDYYLIILTTAS